MRSFLVFFTVISLILHFLYLKGIVESYNAIRRRIKAKVKKKAHSKNRYNELERLNSQDAAPNQNQDNIATENLEGDDSKYDRSASRSSSTVDSLLGSEELDWSSLTFTDRFRLFDGWTFVIMFGDMLQIFAMIYSVGQRDELLKQIQGIAIFCHWCTLLKYLSNLTAYNAIARTIRNSVVIVTKSIIGVFPLLFGFILLGMCLFVQSNRFNSIPVSSYSLYALMNGDSIFDIYFEITQIEFLVGSLYMYVFIFLAICIVQNTFVVIIGDAYAKFSVWIKPVDKDGNYVLDEDDDGEDPLAPFYNTTEKEVKSKNALFKMLIMDRDYMLKNSKKKPKKTRQTIAQESSESLKENETEKRITIAKPTKSLKSLEREIVRALGKLSDIFEYRINQAKTKDEKEDIYDRYIDACERIEEALDKLQEESSL